MTIFRRKFFLKCPSLVTFHPYFLCRFGHFCDICILQCSYQLEFYRLRREVEVVFKRYKSLLGLGNIPTKTKESREVWLNGKMFLALLIEKYLGDIDFSPSWSIRRKPEYMEGDKTDVIYNFYDDTAQSGGNVR